MEKLGPGTQDSKVGPGYADSTDDTYVFYKHFFVRTVRTNPKQATIKYRQVHLTK